MDKKKEAFYLKTHDELTGLYNRCYFEHKLRLIDLSGSYPLSIVIADINGLKFINEVFGFHIGDLMLRKNRRFPDTCGRKGGYRR